MFDECHTPLIFREYAPQYLIGELQLSEHSDSPVLVDAEPAPALADAPVEPYGELASPFPAERFDGSGVEAFRFQWSARDWLLRRDPSTGQSRAPTREEMAHVHRAKSHVAPLDYQRDWLHVSHPAAYAADMVLKEALLSDPEPRRMTYVTTPESHAAEQEVLDDVMGWVAARYPERFTLDHAAGTIHAHAGLRALLYHRRVRDRAFEVSRDGKCRACGLLRRAGRVLSDADRSCQQLVQEDFYLMVRFFG